MSLICARTLSSQVIRNLTSNGLKFTTNGGSVKINCELVTKSGSGISRRGMKTHRILRISVTDTGAGISKVRCKLPFALYVFISLGCCVGVSEAALHRDHTVQSREASERRWIWTGTVQ